MRAGRKMVLIVIFIILVGQLLGNIKVTGRLLIPTAEGQKPYKAVMVITRAVVRIECDKKIFQPFNLDAPRQQRLNINASDLVRIEIDERERKIYLRVKHFFIDRHRNIINQKVEFISITAYYGHLYKEFWAITFAYDKPLDIGYLDQKVIDSINHRAYPVFTKYYFYSTRN